jgi:hypothetical protein
MRDGGEATYWAKDANLMHQQEPGMSQKRKPAAIFAAHFVLL